MSAPMERLKKFRSLISGQTKLSRVIAAIAVLLVSLPLLLQLGSMSSVFSGAIQPI